MVDDIGWLPTVSWNDSYVEAVAACDQQEVGRSVQKKRASKAKAVEQLAKETIKFSESIESLSVKRVAECDKKPEKTGSKKAVQQHETDDTIVLAKSQGKRNSEGISDAVGKKKRRAVEAIDASEEPPVAKQRKSNISASEEKPAGNLSKPTKVLQKDTHTDTVPESAAIEPVTKQQALGNENEKKQQNKKKKSKKRKSVSIADEEAAVERDDVIVSEVKPDVEKPEATLCDANQAVVNNNRKNKNAKDASSVKKSVNQERSTQPSEDKPPATQTSERKSGKPSALDKMKTHLQGGRFRMLNERLYTTKGDEAFQLMQNSPELFTSYHEGFRVQAKSWSKNPVQLALKWLRTKPDGWAVADFGCGDAQIAQELCKTHTVHSFDLYSNNVHVTACNMAKVPCKSGSCNAAIFSLALMGTDYSKFLLEAQRVLKTGGFLWIAEVRSRFVPDGKDTENFAPFLGSLQKLGFKVLKQDVGNRMFVVWIAKKVDDSVDSSTVQWPLLKPCVYKRR